MGGNSSPTLEFQGEQPRPTGWLWVILDLAFSLALGGSSGSHHHLPTAAGRKEEREMHTPLKGHGLEVALIISGQKKVINPLVASRKAEKMSVSK